MRNHPPKHLASAAAILGTAAALAGCGLTNPNTASLGATPNTNRPTKPRAGHAKHPAQARTTTTTTTTTSPAVSGSASPKAAIEQYARLWCNWTSSDLLAHERRLIQISAGGARAQEQAALAAATEPGTHITNTCSIDALTQGEGSAAGDWVLVTSSTTSTPSVQGLAPQFHVTYATVTSQHGRYLVNSWQPQS